MCGIIRSTCDQPQQLLLIVFGGELGWVELLLFIKSAELLRTLCLLLSTTQHTRVLLQTGTHPRSQVSPHSLASRKADRQTLGRVTHACSSCCLQQRLPTAVLP